MESKLEQESLNNIIQESSSTKNEFDSECAFMGHRVSDIKPISILTNDQILMLEMIDKIENSIVQREYIT